MTDEEKDEMRRAMIVIDPRHLIGVLKGELRLSFDDLPEDVKFTAVDGDFMSQSIMVLVEHESFDVTVPGQHLPQLTYSLEVVIKRRE